MSEAPTPLVPHEGWHVLHLFYSIDHGQWNLLNDSEQREAKTRLTELVQEIRSHPDTQLLIFSIATPKADLGFMLLTPDLQDATYFEKRLTLSLGIDVLAPTYSYLSQTERSEYTTSREVYGKDTLIDEEGMTAGTPEFEAKLDEFDERMKHYLKHRMYPVLPDWPVICFYPMSKRRAAHDDYNWYSLPFEKRAQLMKGHATTGRKYSGKILQLISGSTGLDEHEWGVTLLAHDTYQIKSIVYEMRFDEVSARYAEFGDFYIGMQLPLDELFTVVCL
ncbi:heme-dependent peroxidase [Akkermansiaceae bacterium]|nr:heme-dependent peroxidase [Akkermansiaceae bacterium]